MPPSHELASIEGSPIHFRYQMKALANIIAAVALLFFIGYAFNLYKRYPVDSFCKNISATDTPQDVVARAEINALWINPLDKSADEVWVFNQKAPWWRYACIVKFKDGQAADTQVIAVD